MLIVSGVPPAPVCAVLVAALPTETSAGRPIADDIRGAALRPFVCTCVRFFWSSRLVAWSGQFVEFRARQQKCADTIHVARRRIEVTGS